MDSRFAEKNLRRREARQGVEKPRARMARKARRNLDGAFGRADAEFWNFLVTGTTASKKEIVPKEAS